MPKKTRQTEDLFLTLSGDAAEGLYCLGARLTDGLSQIPEMRMEFWSNSSSFDPASILGQRLTVDSETGFRFSGLVVSVEDLGHDDGTDIFAAEIRPWLWLAGLSTENRIFQHKSTAEIIKAACSKLGFTQISYASSITWPVRDYCVQYGETTLAFINRLLEEEGIYYYFQHDGAVEQLVLAADVGGHSKVGEVAFPSANRVGKQQARGDTIYEWIEAAKTVSGKVSLWDYDFNVPSANLTVTSILASPKGANKTVERYGSIGHHITATAGEDRAKALAQAHAAEHHRPRGRTNAPVIRSGNIFSLAHENRSAVNGSYLVVRSTHYMQFDPGYRDTPFSQMNSQVERIAFPPEMALYETEFEAQPESIPYRPLPKTPWPEVPSLLTAVVVGNQGEEIYTDEFGRIKVQFPWDRDGQLNENSSCWARVVMPWAGKDWGFQAIPRIGMEVIIQFERGNIDRPICTGMVYNGTNKPPYPLPDQMNKTGLRTNSTKGGGGFHELTFDDTKDAETVFFQSEKDYKQVIKNNAEITIGMEKKDEGNLTQTIYKNRTETIKTGDVKLTVEEGSRVTSIKTDDTITIEGKSTSTITGDTTTEVKQGNFSHKVTQGNASHLIAEGNLSTSVEKGNMSTAVDKGNMESTVTMGNVTVKATKGEVTIEAGTSITLKVGTNKIVISTSGVAIEGALFSAKAQGEAKVEGALVTLNANGIMTIGGSAVMIN